jgi:ribosome-binding factor A
MEAKAKLKMPVLNKNNGLLYSPNMHFYPKENINQATKIKTLCSNVKYPKGANTQNFTF